MLYCIKILLVFFMKSPPQPDELGCETGDTPVKLTYRQSVRIQPRRTLAQLRRLFLSAIRQHRVRRATCLHSVS